MMDMGPLGPVSGELVRTGRIDFFGQQEFIAESLRRRLGGRLRSLIRFRVVIVEDVEPAIQAIRATMQREWPLIGKFVSEIIETNIRKSYYSGPGRWPPLATSTIVRKLREGTPYGLGPQAQLQWWLYLRGDVEDRLRVYAVQSRYGFQILLDPRSFIDAPYVAVHELGLNKFVPQRSFVQDGIEDSKEEIDNLMRAWIAVKRQMLRRPKRFRIPARTIRGEFKGVTMPSLGGFSFWSWLLVPPNQLLRFLAIAGDIRSVFRGTWTSRSSETFVRNFLLGQFGLTRKVVRRRIRYRVWGGIT